MSPSNLSRALAALIPARRPAYVWGPPGCGKSSVVRQAGDALGFNLVDLRVTLLDPVDLRGLPRLSDDSCVWMPPAFLPRGGEGVLFLDELAQAPPLVQAACLQLTLDRRLGEYTLPDGWAVVAASNRVEDRAGGHRTITPLLNRFVHLDLDVDAEQWQSWAAMSGLAAEVRGFLRFRPNMLLKFDPAAGERAFATPRSWQFVSDALKHAPEDLVPAVVAGCVGDGPAAEFVAYRRLCRSLPDLDVVLQSPTSAPVPHEPAVLYALSGALVERLRADTAPADAVLAYAARLPEEFALLTLRDALAVKPRLAALPAVQSWIAKARCLGLFPAA